jgi:hypothetical protein
VNDTACETCHTGNIVQVIRERFPGARFKHAHIFSGIGNTLIKKHRLTTYPAFVFGKEAEKSPAFREISATFRKHGGAYILLERIVKSYRFIDREPKPGALMLLGATENPPVIEMIRDLAPLINDSFPGLSVAFRPTARLAGNKEKNADWLHMYDSPYGAMEVRAGAIALCAQTLHKPDLWLPFLACRGNDVQDRFEEQIPEPPDEWKNCALKWGLDTSAISACISGKQGPVLFAASAALTDSLHLSDPGPALLLGNRFLISGYHPAMRVILIRELKKALAK